MAKKLLFFAMLFVILFFSLTTISYGQSGGGTTNSESELSLEFLGSTVSPGYWLDTKGLVFDARYGYDASRTLSACFGKSFGNRKLSFVSEFCGHFGLYNGYGPKAFVFSETNILFFESYGQYAKMNKEGSFAYGWLQLERKLNHKIRLGIGGQILKEERHRLESDLGPSFSIGLGKKVTLTFIPLFRVTEENRGKFTPYGRITYVF